MAIDDNVNSPFRDRSYVTWTAFASDGSAYIYEVHSNDYGESFSSPVLVSASNPNCTEHLRSGNVERAVQRESVLRSIHR